MISSSSSFNSSICCLLPVVYCSLFILCSLITVRSLLFIVFLCLLVVRCLHMLIDRLVDSKVDE